MKRIFAAVLMALLAASVEAAEPTVVLSGLNNPAGVAVRPDTGEVFVAESGAGQVVMAKGKEAMPVVTGFPLDSYGKGPKFKIGPLGLAFVGKNQLVVGDGGSLDGEERVRVFELGSPVKAMSVYDSSAKLGPIEPGPKTGRGEGNFYAVAATDMGLYVTANGDDTKGWVLKAPIKGGKIGNLAPFIATKEAVKVDAPVGIAARDGKIYVGQMGEVASQPDSLLCIYNEKTGKLESKLELEDVFDVCALAFSKSGKLYALDFNWPGTEKGALYRVDVKASGAAVSKLADLDKPTALAFGPDGSLYVTVFGADSSSGQLLKFSGDF